MEFGNVELRAILDSAPVGIALLGIDRTVRYCNTAFLEIYGWEHAEIIGARLPIPKHQQEHWEGLLKKLRTGRKFLNIETVRIRKDGTEFYARISGTPVFDGSGSLDAVIGFVTTTEDNHSEQLELRSLEHLIQASSDFMCVVDLELRTLFLNDPGKQVVGLSGDQDVDGRTILDYFSEESRGPIITAVGSVASTGVSLATRLHLKHVTTGDLIEVSCSIFLVRDPHSDKPVSFDFVANRVAAPRLLGEAIDESRQAFSTLLDCVPVGVALVNPSGYILESNKSFQTMLRYSADELAAIPFARLVYPEDLASGRALFLSLMSGSIDHYETDKRLVDKDGNVFLTRMTVRVVRGPNGEPRHTISVVERLPDPSLDGQPRGSFGNPGSFPPRTTFSAESEFMSGHRPAPRECA